MMTADELITAVKKTIEDAQQYPIWTIGITCDPETVREEVFKGRDNSTFSYWQVDSLAGGKQVLKTFLNQGMEGDYFILWSGHRAEHKNTFHTRILLVDNRDRSHDSSISPLSIGMEQTASKGILLCTCRGVDEAITEIERKRPDLVIFSELFSNSEMHRLASFLRTMPLPCAEPATPFASTWAAELRSAVKEHSPTLHRALEASRSIPLLRTKIPLNPLPSTPFTLRQSDQLVENVMRGYPSFSRLVYQAAACVYVPSRPIYVYLSKRYLSYRKEDARTSGISISTEPPHLVDGVQYPITIPMWTRVSYTGADAELIQLRDLLGPVYPSLAARTAEIAVFALVRNGLPVIQIESPARHGHRTQTEITGRIGQRLKLALAGEAAANCDVIEVTILSYDGGDWKTRRWTRTTPSYSPMPTVNSTAA